MSDWFKKNRWPLAIFLAAFFIRLIYLIQYQSNPSFAYPMVDELWHLRWAQEIIGGNWIGNEAYFRGPLYPYFLAIIDTVTGKSIFGARLIQLLIGSLSAVLVYQIGRRLLNKTIGIIAGFGMAIYATLIFYEAMFLIPVLYIFIMLLAFKYLLRARDSGLIKNYLLSGLFIGLAAIARPNILILTPLILLWIYFMVERNKEMTARLKIGAIWLAALLIPVAAVAIRNIAVTGEFILISSQGGVNLYLGNNPDTDGLTMLMPEVAINESLPWSEFMRATHETAEKLAGKSLTAGEESSFWTGKAVDFIFSHPGKFIVTTLKKLVYFLDGFENSDNTDIYFARNFSSIYSILIWKSPIFFPFGLVLPLALAGVIATWKKRKELIPLYIFIVGYIPSVILFLVTARHRLPVVPFMMILAAAGGYYLYHSFRKKQAGKFFLYLTIVVISALLVNRTYFEIGFQNESQIHFNLALSYERDNNLIDAEKEYLKALETNALSPTILNNLGYVQYQLKKYDKALANFKKASDSDPHFASVYNNAALVFEARGQTEEAARLYRQAINVDPKLYRAYLNLGDLYVKMQDFTNAEAAFKQAIDGEPTNPRAYFKLGSLYGRTGKFQSAADYFTEGEKRGEPLASDYINMANIYFATDNPLKAMELYRKAIDREPGFVQAYLNLAVTFQKYRFSADSTLKYLNKTLELDPNNERARVLLNQLKN